MKRKRLIGAVVAASLLAQVPSPASATQGSAERLSSAADEARYRQQPLFYFGGFAIYPWVLARVVGVGALVAAVIAGLVEAAKAGGQGSS
ncbi:hypothetical protein M5J20_07660 [Corynebacterium sp. TA-R-1]|uniref:Secreted protein n=1 Tax=Corynebacterium stercoris TaxID=2943490 RepID=A0ABT1G5S6_9CORY|nr:hypothetical protein [Corynebacterium stercoris]MCP1388067.1 hypothetical protein [Corynebacterium stercoris]